MKTSLLLLATALAAGVVITPGCASRSASASAKPAGTKYIYVPPDTSTRVARNVKVKAGSTAGVMPSSVQTANPEAFGESQRKGSVSRGTGN